MSLRSNMAHLPLPTARSAGRDRCARLRSGALTALAADVQLDGKLGPNTERRVLQADLRLHRGILARGEVILRGEGPKYSGKVDFSDAETKKKE